MHSFFFRLHPLLSYAAVVMLIYEIGSTRSELIRTEETNHYHQIHVKSDQKYELSRRIRFRYVQI